MAWESKLFKFSCSACHAAVTRVGKKCPELCHDCRADRTRLLSLARTNDNYPRKLCKGCGIHMSNLDYGKAQFCTECTTVRERRHNGWADPYQSRTRLLYAANDNRPSVKVCVSCECDLPLTAFGKSKTGGMGVSAECSDCRAIMRAERGREAEYAKQRQRRHDPVKAAMRAYAADVRKRTRLCDKWNAKQKAHIRASGRKIDEYLLDFFKRKSQEERLVTRPWLVPGLTEYQRRKIRSSHDEEFAVNIRLRRRLSDQTRLRKRGRCVQAAKAVRKAIRCAGSLPRFLGYTADDLRVHLESKFTDGMTWEAFHRGEIHIDHKTPLSHYDLTDNDQVKDAWALTNLQPLWAADNLAKGALTDEEWRVAA